MPRREQRRTLTAQGRCSLPGQVYIFLIEMDTAERIRQYHNRVEGALHLLRNFF